MQELKSDAQVLKTDVQSLKQGQERLKTDVQSLKQGQERLKTDVQSLKQGQLESIDFSKDILSYTRNIATDLTDLKEGLSVPIYRKIK